MLALSRSSSKAKSNASDALPYLCGEMIDFFRGITRVDGTSAVVVVVLNLIVPHLCRVSVVVGQVRKRAPSKQVLAILPCESRSRVIELVVFIEICRVVLGNRIERLVDKHGADSMYGTIAVQFLKLTISELPKVVDSDACGVVNVEEVKSQDRRKNYIQERDEQHRSINSYVTLYKTSFLKEANLPQRSNLSSIVNDLNLWQSFFEDILNVLADNVGGGGVVGDDIEYSKVDSLSRRASHCFGGRAVAEAYAGNSLPDLGGKVTDHFSGVDGFSSREVIVALLTLPAHSSTSWEVFDKRIG